MAQTSTDKRIRRLSSAPCCSGEPNKRWYALAHSSSKPQCVLIGMWLYECNSKWMHSATCCVRKAFGMNASLVAAKIGGWPSPSTLTHTCMHIWTHTSSTSKEGLRPLERLPSSVASAVVATSHSSTGKQPAPNRPHPPQRTTGCTTPPPPKGGNLAVGMKNKLQERTLTTMVWP